MAGFDDDAEDEFAFDTPSEDATEGDGAPMTATTTAKEAAAEKRNSETPPTT
jgi:hypothetical protein